MDIANTNQSKLKKFIIMSKPFYFGWLLAFPFYGPVFFETAPSFNYKGAGLITIFMASHLITYFLGGFLLKNVFRWHSLMLVSAIVTFLANFMLFLPFNFIWPLVMVITGAAASIYILGWSVIYSLSGFVKERIGIMALVIIGGNLVLLFFNIMAGLLSRELLLAVSLLSLLLAIVILLIPNKDFKEQIIRNSTRLPIPKKTIIFFFLFIFIIYVNGGFAYCVLIPRIDSLFANYFPYAVYILALLIVYSCRSIISRSVLIYCGVSFIGLAFIVFANVQNNVIGYVLAIVLLETAFALLDLFVWISLNSLAYVFGAPFPVFGFILTANILSILTGDIISDISSTFSNDVCSSLSVLSAVSVFLVILVIPWFLKSSNKAIDAAIGNKDEPAEKINEGVESLLNYLVPNKELTEREMEILELAVLGLTNKKIGEQLFVTENTVKTHLGKIYSKFGVSGKKELIYLFSRKDLLNKATDIKK